MIDGERLSLATARPRDLWPRFRRGELAVPTAGMCDGYVQANLVVLPREQAFDFLLFAQRNPRPCPVIEVTEPGSPEPVITSPGADIRTDLPRYRIFRNGELVDEVADVRAHWRPDLVGFLIGCSFTFEAALRRAGVPLRHIECGCNVPMYLTNRMCRPAGAFHGPLVVSMRPVPNDLLARAVQVTSRFPGAHGAPLHIGDPSALGVRDLDRPDFGDRVEVRPGEVPVFWACGVTPQAVALASRPPLMLTHAPGHMFITGMRDEDLAAL